MEYQRARLQYQQVAWVEHSETQEDSMSFALLYPSDWAALANEVCRRFLNCGALASSPDNLSQTVDEKSVIHPTQ